MAVPALLAVGVLALIVVVTITLVVALRLTLADRRGDAPASTNPEYRMLSRWRWAGILAGVAVAVVTISVGALGRGPLLASVAFGLCVLGGVLVGELRVRPAHDALRAATLERRSIRSYLPPVLGIVVALSTVVLVGVMIATTAAGSPDDLHRAGRTLRYAPDPAREISAGPWPGSYYTAPAMIALVLAAIATAVVLRQVTLRPRAGDPVGDDALRRRSAEAVTAAWGVATSIPLAGISIIAVLTLSNLATTPASWRVAGGGLLLVGLGAMILVLWCLATLVVPRGRRVPAATQVPTDVPAAL